MSKRHSYIIFFIGLLFGCCQAFANGGSLADTKHVYSPTKTAIQTVATIYSGSLQANIIRLAKQFGWQQVIWKSPDDYRWVGTVHLRGSLRDIFRQILKDYPLQARFYEGNHVLVVAPRTFR